MYKHELDGSEFVGLFLLAMMVFGVIIFAIVMYAGR